MQHSRTVLIVLSTISLMGCNLMFKDREPVESQTTLTNTASMYCVEKEGQLETVTEANKRVTYCLLPDGDKQEQWALYNNRSQPAE
ncbi:DUF333 domain-containing protein [Thaumasiovibrio subtropicus]|uniref:putative hemolysin n=1 Tax=Thaumasiovibrio subtropicus TaxID=1891207 RepID=UPI000B35F88F|nr:DUF333 domain-containing protein [Thaumasiovibrio subtropicus]